MFPSSQPGPLRGLCDDGLGGTGERRGMDTPALGSVAALLMSLYRRDPGITATYRQGGPLEQIQEPRNVQSSARYN